MDYQCSDSSCADNQYATDLRLAGEWQFNAVTNAENICAVLGAAVTAGCSAITEFAAVCGNGVLEQGEECECQDLSNSCRLCASCNLQAGAECTPDAWGYDGQCCQPTGGTFKAFTTACKLGKDAINTGYCTQGRCEAHHDFCPRFKVTTNDGRTGDAVCATPASTDNDCVWGCQLPDAADPGTCYNIANSYPAKSKGAYPGAAPNGNICRFNGEQGAQANQGFGVCKDKVCVNADPAGTPPPPLVLTTTTQTTVTATTQTFLFNCVNSDNDWDWGYSRSCDTLAGGDYTIQNGQQPCSVLAFKLACPVACDACTLCGDRGLPYRSNGQKIRCGSDAEVFDLGCDSEEGKKYCAETCQIGPCAPAPTSPPPAITTTTPTTTTTTTTTSTTTTTTTTTTKWVSTAAAAVPSMYLRFGRDVTRIQLLHKTWTMF